ncbi:MAG: DUF3179 domain-containing (seleno)protein [Pseudomonadota bacterium]
MQGSRAGSVLGPSRRTVMAGLSGLAAGVATGAVLPGLAQAASEAEIDRAIASLITPSRGPLGAAEAQRILMRDAGLSAMPGLVLAHRFSPLPRTETAAIMARITGEPPSLDWFDWMLWQEAHPEVRPTAGYVGLKRAVFEAIDPEFEIFLRDPWLEPERARIRFEEVTWGGVRKDGIPSLDNPTLIGAGEATYLRDSDPVFGVSINGDVRAYPLRIMGWHEMFNEVIGGVPVALAYCTLCGAGILFETQIAGRPAPFVFGSSGFLYRSNKLMFDRETHTLWNQFTGRPVIGPLVENGIELRQRPVTIQPWGEWRAANPETRVLSLDTGHARDYGSGVVYRDYFASGELMFPALVNRQVLKQKDYVFGIRQRGAARAWPLEVFRGGRVINDAVGDTAVVLIGDAAGRTVRAYERGARRFEAAADGGLSEGGERWEITEEALIGPGGTRMPRVAGHIAYWFAWDNYLGLRAELYQG